MVVAQGAKPESRAESPNHSVMVRIFDLDQHYENAKLAGAVVISEPANYPYGERQYTVIDIGGHVWTFSQSMVDVEPSSWGGTLVQEETKRIGEVGHGSLQRDSTLTPE